MTIRIIWDADGESSNKFSGRLYTAPLNADINEDGILDGDDDMPIENI